MFYTIRQRADTIWTLFTVVNSCLILIGNTLTDFISYFPRLISGSPHPLHTVLSLTRIALRQVILAAVRPLLYK